MDERRAVLERAYALFNLRDVEGILALVTEDVQWPDVLNAAVLRGKAALRPYWASQFAVANPQVQPTEFRPVGKDLVAVIDQRVFDLHGQLLMPPTTVFHRFTFREALICRMAIFTERRDAFES